MAGGKNLNKIFLKRDGVMSTCLSISLISNFQTIGEIFMKIMVYIREGGDIGLFITLVPKGFCNTVFLSVGFTTLKLY